MTTHFFDADLWSYVEPSAHFVRLFDAVPYFERHVSQHKLWMKVGSLEEAEAFDAFVAMELGFKDREVTRIEVHRVINAWTAARAFFRKDAS